MTRDQQLLLIVPSQRGSPEQPRNFQGAFEVVVAEDLEDLAKKLNFPGVKQLHEVWGDAYTDSSLLLRGGPKEETDKKTGITFVKVCSGTFRMGTEKKEAPFDDETPAHPVTLDSFEITKTEITNAQYRMPFGKGKFGEDFLPSTKVNWTEAKAFCENLGEILPDTAKDYVYGLPTEAEWEYAARGGSTTLWSFGDDEKQLGDYAWFRENSDIQVHPVQQKRPNPLGLHDMHGNVWEWVEDCYDADAYKNRSPAIIDRPVNPGINSCERRMLRGGSAWFSAEDLRSASRGRLEPEDADDFIGFRCVRRPRR